MEINTETTIEELYNNFIENSQLEDKNGSIKTIFYLIAVNMLRILSSCETEEASLKTNKRLRNELKDYYDSLRHPDRI